MLERAGGGLDWAARQAQCFIHDNDVEGLKRTLAEHPALLSWRGVAGGLLADATNAYGDSFSPAREKEFTRLECAEALIDSGAVVDASVIDGLIHSRARGQLQLYRSKGLLPRTLRFAAALGDLDLVREWGESSCSDLAALSEGFRVACRFEHEAIASYLLRCCIARDAELGKQIDAGPGSSSSITAST